MPKKTEPIVIDPTAPGGMSMAALRLELAEEHGMPMAKTKGMKFPALIDAVVQGRLAQDVMAEHEGESVGVVEEALVDAGLDPDDFDDLAEFDEPDVPCPECGADLAGSGTCEHYPADAQITLTPAGFGHPGDDVLEEFTDIFNAVTALSADNIDLPDSAPLFIGMPTTKDYIFDGHSGTGPSAAERWIACTASLGATRQFLETLTPNQRREFASGSTAARQGTTAHAVGEVKARVLLGEITPEEAEATLLELTILPDDAGEAYDDAMDEYVDEYVDLVRGFVDDGREVLIEQRVEAVIELMTVTNGEPDLHTISGSLDLGVMPTEEQPVLVVGDLKYGEGIEVHVNENPQIRIYALGLLALIVERYGSLPEWLVDVEYYIIQPRLGGIKTYVEPIDTLLDWQDEVLSKALTEALGGARAGASFNPGKVQCQWCPVRGSCPALIEQRVSEGAELFTVVSESEYNDGPGAFPETSTLDNATLARYYSQIKGLVDILGPLKEEAQRRLYRGEHVPGYHLVNYSPPRSWTEEAQMRLDPSLQRDEGGVLSPKTRALLWKDPTLVTPATAEKLLGPEEFKDVAPLIIKPDRRPVVAPEGDRRSAWEGKAPEAMFADETDTEVE